MINRGRLPGDFDAKRIEKTKYSEYFQGDQSKMMFVAKYNTCKELLEPFNSNVVVNLMQLEQTEQRMTLPFERYTVMDEMDLDRERLHLVANHGKHKRTRILDIDSRAKDVQPVGQKQADHGGGGPFVSNMESKNVVVDS